MRTVKGEYIVTYYSNGKIRNEEYFLNGELHRENGIAFKSWYSNGNKCNEQYFLNGELHREHGIAVKSWYDNGNICVKQYFLNGEILTKEQFENRNNSCSVSVSGKIVEIDGKRYKLKEIND